MLNIFARVDSYADAVAQVTGFERHLKELYPEKTYQKMDLTFDGGRTVVGCHIFLPHVTIKVVQCIPGDVEHYLAKLNDRFGWKPHFIYQAYVSGAEAPISVYDHKLTIIKMVDAYYAWESGGTLEPKRPAYYHIFEGLFEQAKVDGQAKKDVSNIICIRVENSGEDYRMAVRRFKAAINSKYEGKVAFRYYEPIPYLNGRLNRLEIISEGNGYVEPPTVIVDFVVIPANQDYKLTATILYKMYQDAQLRIPNFYIGFRDISLMVKFLTIYHQCYGFEKRLVTWRTPRYENTYLSMFDMAYERACIATIKKKLNEEFGTKSTLRNYISDAVIDSARYGLEAMRKYWEDDEAVTANVLKDMLKYEEDKAVEKEKFGMNRPKPAVIYESTSCMGSKHWLEKEVNKTMRHLKGYGGYTVVAPIWGSKDIKKVIFNDPATIIIWYDGTKTVVKATNEKFDPEKGLAMAFAKKYLGNEGNYYETFKKWLPKEVKKNEKSRRRSIRKKKA